MSLNVRVITPAQVVWDAAADEIILPTSTGQLGVLKDHAPLLTALDIGVMRVKAETGRSSSHWPQQFKFCLAAFLNIPKFQN